MSDRFGFWITGKNKSKIKHIGYESAQIAQVSNLWVNGRIEWQPWYCNFHRVAKKQDRFYLAGEEPEGHRFCYKCIKIGHGYATKEVHKEFFIGRFNKALKEQHDVVLTPLSREDLATYINRELQRHYQARGVVGFTPPVTSQESYIVGRGRDCDIGPEVYVSDVSVAPGCVDVMFRREEQLFIETLQVYDFDKLTWCIPIRERNPEMFGSWENHHIESEQIHDHLVAELMRRIFPPDNPEATQHWQAESEEGLFG
jgi:hypothetical protein